MRIPAFAVFDHFSAPAQRANLCDTGDYSAFHSHAKLKLLIGIMPIRIDGELHHGFFLLFAGQRSRRATASCHPHADTDRSSQSTGNVKIAKGQEKPFSESQCA
jgi:hypothetical protein